MFASRNSRLFFAKTTIRLVLAVVLSSTTSPLFGEEADQIPLTGSGCAVEDKVENKCCPRVDENSIEDSVSDPSDVDNAAYDSNDEAEHKSIQPSTIDAVFQVEISDEVAADSSRESGMVDQVAFPPRKRWRTDRQHNEKEARRAKIRRMPMTQKLNVCLELYGKEKLEGVDKRSPWGIMHAAISLGQNSLCQLGDRKLNAVEWLLNNGSCRNMRLMFVDGDGKLRTRSGPGFEGHEGQLLAILAQSGVSPHEVLTVENHKFKVTDLIRKEMDSCRPGTELTFKLIGLSYYLDSDATWVSDDGQAWDIQRLIAEELEQPVNGVTCGGTHRLMGLSFTVQRRIIQGRELKGEWLRARDFINDYHEYAFSLQNPDGSFSTSWFEGRESMQDSQRRLQTTGHILEWLVYSLPNDQMRDPRLVRSVNYLATLMLVESDTKWSVGPKGHAIRSLDLYRRKQHGESVPSAMFGQPRYLR